MSGRVWVRIVFAVAALLAASASSAQTPTVALPKAFTEIPLGTKVGESSSKYDDGRRRDPFVSLIVPKAPASGPLSAARPRAVPGLVGIAISDIVVKGLVKSGATLIALLQGPDGRTYMARTQDRLQDGVVTRIDSDAVVFTERSPDAAGQLRAHDVRKPLRAAASGSGGE